MIAGVSAAVVVGAAAVVIAGVVVGAGVAIGQSVAASEAADATKYAADRAAEAQKYSSEQQRMASDHEADLLFKTEQADRELGEKQNKEDRSEEAQMMKMFGMIDDIETEESTRVDRRGSNVDVWGEYEYPEPISDDEMSFS